MSIRLHQRTVLLALVFAALTALTSAVAAQAPDAKLEELEEQAFKQAAALVSPSIVRIQTVGGLDRIGRVLTGTGPTTGLVVSADGYVISSSFNFASKPASVLVTLLDGRRFPAEIVANDKSRMLTLLKIEAKELVPATAAPKDSLKVGQWSLALGRTFDSPLPSMSVGIVSALNRIWGKAIQTDAKVSPTNYGGPLVDIEGRVMGVLVPLSSRGAGETAGVEWYDSGIGFAIPLADVYATLDRLKAGTDLRPGLMGITFKGRDIYAAAAEIDRVRYDSPAQKGGLKAGDVIVEVDGQKVVRQAQVRHAIGNKLAGDAIKVTVKRGDELVKADLTLVAELKAYESAFLGLLPIREGADADGKNVGVGVRYVYADSPAEKIGLKTRDRIIRFNDAEVTDAAALLDAVSRLRPQDEATLVYRRGDAEMTATVELSAVPNSILAELRSAAIPSPKSDDTDAKAGDEKKTDKEKSDADAGPKTGRFTETVAAHEHAYWAYVPDSYNPDYDYGLMVWIHPNGDTMEAAVFKAWQAICEQRGIIILAPKAKNVGGWNLNEAEFVKETVEQFQADYSIDPARVFLHSFSNGGQFAYHLAFKYRDLFRGIATAGAALRARPPENNPEFRLQFHFVCGDKDNLYPLVSRTMTGLRRLKFPTSFTIIKAYSHKYPPIEQVQEIGRWADALDRL